MVQPALCPVLSADANNKVAESEVEPVLSPPPHSDIKDSEALRETCSGVHSQSKAKLG